MERPRIIIADEDFNYIIPLQLRFVEYMFEQINLEIFTDHKCFEEVMQMPQTIDILIISEEWYTEDLKRHNIRHGFVMKESSDDLEIATRFVTIYKYTNVKEIFAIILGTVNDLSLGSASHHNDPEMILVTSAIGGTGKTTIAMGVAAVLAEHLKRTLYINVDYLQGFQNYLKNAAPIADNEVYMNLSSGRNDVFAQLRHLIRKEKFDYIPPFKGALLSLGVDHSVGEKIARQALLSKEYDYVVVDMDSTFDADKMNMLEEADRIIFVVTQSDYSLLAMNRFLDNVELTDKEKQMFICNKYDANEKNSLVSEKDNPRFWVNEYVEKIPDYWKANEEKFSSHPGIQKIAMTIM